MTKTALRITGMTCGGCVQRVESALRGVRGVSDARVHLLSESADVSTTNGAVPAQDLIGAVRAAGYDAEVIAARGDLINQSDEKEKLRRHRQALVQAIGLVLPILILEHFHHAMWSSSRTSDLLFRFTEIALFIMLALSPAGSPILTSGWQAILHRTGNMDLLITLGVAVAFVSSLFGVALHDDSFVHLHAAAMILGLVCVGRYLEARARGRAAMAMKQLARRVPRTALVQRGDTFRETPLERIDTGDILRVPPHEAIPTDGIVLGGGVSIDESLMTGEPMPVMKNPGDTVMGGSVVVEGVLEFQATAPGSRSAMARIMELVSAAQSSRTQMQELADRVAAVFTPVVLLIALLVFSGWLIFAGSPSNAIRSAVAVLVVACPCALGLATPVVVLAASGAAALMGILVRDAEMLESLAKVDTVIWDKTGTLTSASHVVREILLEGDQNEADFLRLAASAEQLSSHPLAKALVAEAQRRKIELIMPDDFRTVPGRGIVAIVKGSKIVAGSAGLLTDEGVALPSGGGEATPDLVRIFVAIDSRPAGQVHFNDPLRPAARAAVQRLKDLGIENRLLTGDGEARARQVANDLGIERFVAQASPQDKVRHVQEIKREGRRIAMVGDGVNDAAALAAADVGIAFAAGADLAAQAAGVQLVGSSPALVPDAIELARQSLRIIRQNLFWAFFYNTLMIPLAAIGRLPPQWAAGAMMISSLTVVLNALRIRGRRRA
jgi:Cu+-exporting ATPase